MALRTEMIKRTRTNPNLPMRRGVTYPAGNKEAMQAAEEPRTWLQYRKLLGAGGTYGMPSSWVLEEPGGQLPC